MAPVATPLSRWTERLLDTTARNRLINYRSSGTLVLETPPTVLLQVLSELGGVSLSPSIAAVCVRQHAGDLHPLSPASSPDVEPLATAPEDTAPARAALDEAALRSLCRRLRRAQRAAAAERGIHVLHLAVGYLHWRPADGTDALVSPLLLLPVVLDAGRGERWELTALDDRLVVNPALRLRLRSELGLELPAAPALGDADALGCFHTELRRLVAEREDWAVREGTAVALLSFAKEALYRDLLEHGPQIAGHPIVAALGTAGGAGGVPAGSAEEELGPLVLDADHSQRAAVSAALRGESFVLFGPPGTGKSQTIANIIAALAAAGRRSLFVAEKQAAVDAVLRRLRSVGLEGLVLNLHESATNRSAVIAELSGAMRSATVVRESRDAWREFSRAEALLDSYGEALLEPRGRLGWSLERLVGDAVARRQRLQALGTTEVPVSSEADALELEAAELAEIEDVARRVADGLSVLVAQTGRPWNSAELATLNALGAARAVAFVERSLRLRTDIGALVGRAAERLGHAELASPERLDDLASLADLLAARPSSLPRVVGAEQTHALRSALGALAREQGARVNAEGRGRMVAGDAWRVVDVGLRVRLEESQRAVRGAHLLDNDCIRLNGSQLRHRVTALEAAAERLGDAAKAAAWLLTELDGAVPGRLPSLAGAGQLAELVGLCAKGAAIPVSWLEGDVAAQLRSALAELADAWTTEQDAAAQAGQLFGEGVCTPEFDTVLTRVAGRARLGAFGEDRALRQQIAQLSITGSYDPSLLDQLPLAAAWRLARSRRLESERAVQLLAGTDVAWNQIDAVLGKIERARALVAAHPDLEGRFELLTRPLPELEGVLPAAEHLARVLRDLELQTAAAAGFDVSDLAAEEIASAATQCQAAAQTLHGVLKEVTALEATARRPLTLEALSALGELSGEAERAEAESARALGSLRAFFGPSFSASEAEIGAALAALDWLDALHGSFASGLDPGLLELSVNDIFGRAQASAIRGLVEDWRAARDEVAALCGLSRSRLEGPDGLRLLEPFLCDAEGLEAWRLATNARRALVGHVGEALVQDAAALANPAGGFADLVMLGLVAGAIDQVVRSDPRLHEARSGELERARCDLAHADRRASSDEAPALVRNACGRRWAMIGGDSHPAAKALERERHKSRHFRSVRSLLADPALRGAIGVVKPCFAMSPTTVAAFLPDDVRFDVVIFDEASQITPEDAVGAIYRGAQLIVAGDERQLPPTPFFLPGDDGDDEQDDETSDIVAVESLLGLAASTPGIATFSLRWHYRSRHEALIAFANEHYYADVPMTVFPAADAQRSPGVVFHHVADGVYERGTTRTNPLEARRVVEVVLGHLRRQPAPSIGVVAFSRPQAELITDLLEKALVEESIDVDLADPTGPVFVKNLETVQGDDRDVIVLSVGYGSDRRGRRSGNFGPLSRRDGWRRLNVAITRARSQMDVVTSLRNHEIPDGLAGGADLKAFLDYAERCGSPRAGGRETDRSPESPLEEDVIAALVDWGYDVACQVGVGPYRVDIAVRDPERAGCFVLGIECDGAAYHASRDARERDRLRQEVLEDLGWRLHRVWGPAWFRNTAEEAEALRRAVAAALQHAASPGPRDGTSDDGGLEGNAATVDVLDLDRGTRHGAAGADAAARTGLGAPAPEGWEGDTLETAAQPSQACHGLLDAAREPGDTPAGRDDELVGTRCQPDTSAEEVDDVDQAPGVVGLVELLIGVVEDNGPILGFHAVEAAARRARLPVPVESGLRRQFALAAELAVAQRRILLEAPEGVRSFFDSIASATP